MCRMFLWGQKGEEKKINWVAWETLCRSKKKGGLGFRSLEVFNRALLAKQAWRIMTCTDSLMARVLKNKYFPSSTFLEASIKPNVSYTWRSIISVKDVIKMGARRLIGDGKESRIWGVPWIPSLPGGTIFSVNSDDEGKPVYVSDLMVEDGWNGELLNEYFTEEEAQAIKKVFIPSFPRQDTWSWGLTKSGAFTVKSAYHRILNSEWASSAASGCTSQDKVWDNIWHAKVPQKIKFFCWRAVRNAIPTLQNLTRRGMEVDPICSRCGEGVESDVHMLATCPEAAKAWYFSALRLDTKGCQVFSFGEWVGLLLDRVKEKKWWNVFWSMCWSICLDRNSWYFNKVGKNVV